MLIKIRLLQFLVIVILCYSNFSASIAFSEELSSEQQFDVMLYKELESNFPENLVSDQALEAELLSEVKDLILAKTGSMFSELTKEEIQYYQEWILISIPNLLNVELKRCPNENPTKSELIDKLVLIVNQSFDFVIAQKLTKEAMVMKNYEYINFLTRTINISEMALNEKTFSIHKDNLTPELRFIIEEANNHLLLEEDNLIFRNSILSAFIFSKFKSFNEKIQYLTANSSNIFIGGYGYSKLNGEEEALVLFEKSIGPILMSEEPIYIPCKISDYVEITFIRSVDEAKRNTSYCVESSEIDKLEKQPGDDLIVFKYSTPGC